MNIYLIAQNTNNDYDTYDSAVVIAPDEEAARNMHPHDAHMGDTWTDPENVVVVKIGVSDSDESEVVCASFNAG